MTQLLTSSLLLILEAFIPVILAIMFFLLQQHTAFSKLPYWMSQLFIGAVFGVASIMGTEFGIPMNGFYVNCRDAAPMVAGLLFGGPAGIIAGLMGGIERWFAAFWGAGYFTRIACSISTCVAGFFSAFLHRFMFDKKKATPALTLGCGAVMEIFHMSMVLLTNSSDTTRAITVIDACFVPMVTAVAFSCWMSTLSIGLISGEIAFGKSHEKKRVPLFGIIQRWLLASMAVTFVLAVLFDYFVQLQSTKSSVEHSLNLVIDETEGDIESRIDDYMVSIAKLVKKEIISEDYDLDDLVKHYSLSDIILVNNDGIVADSNNESYIGFDMSSTEKSSEFLCLLEGTSRYTQDFMPTVKNKSISKKFAGVSYADGFIMVSYDEDALDRFLDDEIDDVAKHKTVNGFGGVIVYNDCYTVVSCTKSIDVKDIYAAGVEQKKALASGNVFKKTIGGVEYYEASKEYLNYYIAVLYPVEMADIDTKLALYVSAFSLLLIFALTYAIIDLLTRNVFVKQIIKIDDSLSKITKGDLDVVVDVRTSSEFSSLSDYINNTVQTLKQLIAEEAARIDKELKFAKQIQESALPSVFPAFPDIASFDIYARMDTAKSVGGDFYDFYMTDIDTLQFLIADVSGKGIPAAMFMMRAKSTLKGFAQNGKKVNEVFREGNNVLCQENDAGMFVTAWQGSINLNTGLVEFANAGHNLPAVKRKGGKFELYSQKVNLVLAGMEGVPYAMNEMQLYPGDIIFLYTDGVNEATDIYDELYGEERMLDALNAKEYGSLKDMCDALKEDIDLFVKGRDQFDDITMVAFEYKGV